MIITTEKNLNSQYMKLIFKIVVLLLFASSCSSTKEETAYDVVKEYLFAKLDTVSANQIKNVFIVTENGCTGCNKSFMNLALLEIDNPKSIIIVKARGNIIDISPLEEPDLTNVIIDNRGKQKDLDSIFKASRFIRLGKRDIDTVITIKAQGIIQDFEYIQNMLARQ